MLRFLKKAFTMVITFFNISYANSCISILVIHCISMDNQECKARPKIIDVNNNDCV